MLPRVQAALAVSLTLAAASAGDWSNLGGGPTRSGRADVIGPTEPIEAWETPSTSIISWHPVIEDGRVFCIRETGFPGPSGPGDRLVCLDLETGEQLWDAEVPYAGNSDNEWIAYVGGVSGGRVYTARGGSGRDTPIHAFDTETGRLVWSSLFETAAGPQDGIVFAPNGDPIVGDPSAVARLDAATGGTVWETPRSCSVSGNCGVSISGDGVFFDEPSNDGTNTGQRIVKLSLATGDRLYESPLMIGFTAQNAPFLSPDGSRVYFSRTQNNTLTDSLFAFEDTGTEFVELWNRPVRWTTSHEHGIADNGDLYTFLPGDEFVRLDAETGDVAATAGVLAPIGTNLSARTAVDAAGTVYVSNGWASSPPSDGRVWAFDADLTVEHFTVELNRQNSGGPSLGSLPGSGRGVLVLADRTAVRAYAAPGGCNPADLADPLGVLDLADIQAFVIAFTAGDPAADLAEPAGVLDLADIQAFVIAFTAGCQ